MRGVAAWAVAHKVLAPVASAVPAVAAEAEVEAAAGVAAAVGRPRRGGAAGAGTAAGVGPGGRGLATEHCAPAGGVSARAVRSLADGVAGLTLRRSAASDRSQLEPGVCSDRRAAEGAATAGAQPLGRLGVLLRAPDEARRVRRLARLRGSLAPPPPHGRAVVGGGGEHEAAARPPTDDSSSEDDPIDCPRLRATRFVVPPSAPRRALGGEGEGVRTPARSGGVPTTAAPQLAIAASSCCPGRPPGREGRRPPAPAQPRLPGEEAGGSAREAASAAASRPRRRGPRASARTAAGGNSSPRAAACGTSCARPAGSPCFARNGFCLSAKVSERCSNIRRYLKMNWISPDVNWRRRDLVATVAGAPWLWAMVGAA